MQKARTLLILGIWVAVLPYLGFPFIWKNILFTITGLVLMYFSYILYREFKIKTGDNGPKTFDNFSENNDFKTKINETEKEEVYQDNQNDNYNNLI